MRLLVLAAWAAVLLSAAGSIRIASPSGETVLTLTSGERLGFSATFHGQPLIGDSRLGLTLDGEDLGSKTQFARTDRYSVNETYPIYGVHSTAVNRGNGVKIAAVHGELKFTIEARAYNDGVAFRFLLPDAAKARVPDAGSSFVLPVGSAVWYHGLDGHYEGVHIRQDIADVPAGAWAAVPLTFQLAGGAGYGSITESALSNYAGMVLQADGSRTFRERLGHSAPPSYPFVLRYKGEEQKMAEPAAIRGPITTPWRVVVAAKDLNGLVNTDLITNVAPPPDKALFPKGLHTDWIKPGRSLWRYLDGGDNSFEGMKEFARYAQQLGFEYNLLEAFWQKWTNEELRELVRYSKERGVGLILWMHSKELRDKESRRKFFDMCRDSGVAGVKIDFFDHEAKNVVDLYEASLREGAEHHLLVDFHGANKPTGQSRTWPNELTREGVQGLEHRNMKEWATHNTTLPFTRLIAGPADYTPVIFGDRRKETSWAHQIATAAIFTSPMLIYGAHPKSLLENPAVDVIKSIPSVWDETVVLPVSKIGEIAAFARRRGDAWFLAILNGAAGKTVKLDLSFLGKGKYQASLVRDDTENPAAVKIENAPLSNNRSLEVDLRPGGGFIGRFTPAK